MDFSWFKSIIPLITGVGGFVVGALALLFAIRSHRLSVRSLYASKTFEKADLRISYCGLDQHDDFIIAVPIRDHRVTEVQLPLVISNVGEKTAEDISVYVKMRKELAYGGFVIKDKTSTATHMSTTGNFFSIICEEKPINPAMKIINVHPLSFRTDTVIKGTVESETRGDKTIGIRYALYYAYEIHCVVSYRDNRPIGRRFTVRVLNTLNRSIPELISEYNDECCEVFKRQPFLRRLFRMLNPRDDLGLKRVAIIRLKGEVLEDPKIPIDRLTYENLVSIEGVEDERGLFVPQFSNFKRVDRCQILKSG